MIEERVKPRIDVLDDREEDEDGQAVKYPEEKRWLRRSLKHFK